MKKYLIAIAMVLALSMNANAVAQKHRHTPRTEQVDSTKNNPDAIEAFSDTTAVSSTSDAADEDEQQVIQYSTDDARGILHEIFSGLDDTAIAGMIFAAFVLFLLFVLAPILIICAVFYFIHEKLCGIAKRMACFIRSVSTCHRVKNIADRNHPALQQNLIS